MANIKIEEKSYSTEKKIEIYNHDQSEWESLETKLTSLNFSTDQADFLSDLFHKLVNRKVTF